MRWSIPSSGYLKCSGRNYYMHWCSSLVQLNFGENPYLHGSHDHCGHRDPGSSRKRNPHSAADPQQQLGAAAHQRAERSRQKKVLSDTTWLARFGDKDWRDHLRKAAQDFKFNATLKPRLDRAIEDWHADQPLTPKPVVVHEPPDDELQTGASRLLGGAISIHSPWSDAHQQDPPE